MYKGFLYKITCKVTNCVYIGITTKTIKRRFSQHFRTAYREDSGMYHTYLYRSIRKYGIENFEINELLSLEFDLLDKLIKELEELEINTIEIYRKNKAIKLSNCSIRKIELGSFIGSNNRKESYKESKLYKINLNRKIKVKLYSLNKLYIETYNSIADAAKLSGTSKTNIGKCISGERKSAGGFIWKKM